MIRPGSPWFGSDGKVEIRRAPGKLHNLEEVIRQSPIDGTYGIGHTRWATHGRPTEENAHPHRDCTGQIVVVHNGIVENYVELKRQLEKEGHKFVTETDTEIIAHLVEKHMNEGGPLEDAVRKTVRQLTGVYSVAILSAADPNKIVAARTGPPSVIGIGQGEFFVASDIPAILAHTRDMFFLADGDIAVLTPQGVRVMDLDGNTIERAVQHITWDPIMAEKGGFKHFMQKEIFEQPRAVRDTLLASAAMDSGKVFLDKMDITEADFREFTNIKIVACGTSWHAALTGKFMIEKLARIPVEVDYGSEFRYRDPIIGPNTLTVCISQSGETADTLAAQREAKHKGSKTLAICNVFGSMITREAAGTILTHAGPEIGVASTKAFTGQLTALMLLAMYLGQVRGTLSEDCSKLLLQEFMRIPHKMEMVLRADEGGTYEGLARQFFRHTNFLYLGRGSPLPHRSGRRAKTEGNFLHSCRGLPSRRDEARPQRADRRKSPGRHAGHARRQRSRIHDALRKKRFQHQGSEGARRHCHFRGHRKRSPGARGFRSRDRRAAHDRTAGAAARSAPAATARLLYRRAPRLRRGPAAQPGEIGDRGIIHSFSQPRLLPALPIHREARGQTCFTNKSFLA